MNSKVYLFGIRPTDNKIHLGHITILKKMIDDIFNNKEEFEKTNLFEIKIFLASYHALTTGTDEKKKEIYNQLLDNEYSLFSQITKIIEYYIKEKSKKLNQEYKILLNVPVEPEIFVEGNKTKYFHIQYDSQLNNKEILHLFMLIQNVIGYSEITSIPTIKEYKENMKKGEYLSAGFMNYPILQIADIIYFNSDYVYLGIDQKPNLKIYKKIINKLEKIYDIKLKKETKFIFKEEVLKGPDGRKMSKSYGNVISLFDNKKEIEKKLFTYKTDGHKINEPGDYTKCEYYNFIKNLISEEKVNELKTKCNTPGRKCIDCKIEYNKEIIKLKDILQGG